MNLEIRPMEPEEHAEFNRLACLSFAAPFVINMPPEMTLCGFVDGKMATTYSSCPLTMQFNGSRESIAGITAVTTMPLYRRMGFLRKITETHLKKLYETGEHAISALNASNAAIYQRYGYGIVSFKKAYTTEPRFLKFALNGTPGGELREADEKSDPLLLELFHRFAEKRTGYLHRNETFEVSPAVPFTVMNFPPPPPVPIVRIVYYEGGEALGYLIYSVEQDMAAGRPMGQRLLIRDLVWLTPSAYRGLWGFLSHMDLVREIAWLRVPPDDPLPYLVLEPKALNCTTSDGMLARIVDVEKALPKRPYAEEGSLTFEIADEVCPWNSGTWKLETSGKESSVTRTTEKAGLKIPASTLAMLVFGHISASEAARIGRLDVQDHGVLKVWDRVMKTEHMPFCPDMF